MGHGAFRIPSGSGTYPRVELTRLPLQIPQEGSFIALATPATRKAWLGLTLLEAGAVPLCAPPSPIRAFPGIGGISNDDRSSRQFPNLRFDCSPYSIRPPRPFPGGSCQEPLLGLIRVHRLRFWPRSFHVTSFLSFLNCSPISRPRVSRILAVRLSASQMYSAGLATSRWSTPGETTRETGRPSIHLPSAEPLSPPD